MYQSRVGASAAAESHSSSSSPKPPQSVSPEVQELMHMLAMMERDGTRR